jgi:hypothetical protein
MRYSKEIGSRMVSCFNAFHALSIYITQRKYDSYDNYTDFVVAIDRHVKAMTSMLEMFEQTLSLRKQGLLRNYR